MKQKILFCTLLWMLAAILPAHSETLTVYDGTTTNQYVPAYIFYWDDFTRSEFVIPATDLADMAGGTISAITFYTTADNIPYTSASQADVYLKEVSNPSISSYVTKANATIVYHGTIEILKVGSTGEVTITFSTPFPYSGGNLLIGTENTTDANYKNIKFYGQTVSGASIAGSNTSSAASAPTTQRNFIPKTTFTYEPYSPYARPTDLDVVNITARTAQATWLGNANALSYNLRYRSFTTTEWDFEDAEQFDDWTIVDKDGDGYNWEYHNSGYTAHSGTGLVISASYDNDSRTALTPNNWLISPVVSLGGHFSFWAAGQDSNYPSEKFGVYLCVGNSTDPANFTQIGSDQTATSTMTEYKFDLSAYAGQTGRIAIVHHNVTDMFVLNVDDITYSVPGNWTTATGVTSPYTINGLAPETIYEVEVQAVYADDNSKWTYPVEFITQATDAMPTDLTVNNVTDRSGVATWNGVQDSYNLRYRKLDFFEDFDNGLPSNWTAIDNDGDGHNWGSTNYGNGVVCVTSESYINSSSTSGTALTPDNWLVTPKVTIGNLLTFDAWGQDVNFFAEVFNVYVSTTGTNVDDFVAISEDLTATHERTEYTFDLNQFAGQEGYIAIRHYNCTDMFRLNVDNFAIGGYWETISNVTSPQTIMGLEAEALHAVQVQGVLENGTTNWTGSANFTTLAEQYEEIDLATMVANGMEGRKHQIENGDLTAVFVSGDGKTLYCKDNNKYASPNSISAGQIDYIAELTNLMSNRSYDESNWVALRLQGEGSLASLKGKVLSNVKGTLNHKVNPELLLEATPTGESGDTYTPNTFIVPSFGASTQTSAAHITYFFVNPKPMEVATVTWAMWDANAQKFVSPPKNDQINQAGLTGSIDVDFSLYNGTAPTLQNGDVCTFTAIINNSVAGPSDAQAHRAPGDVSYSAYALDDFAKIGSIVDGVVTGINDVKAGSHEVLKVVYSNPAGQVSDRPFDGVNIVVTTYTDGSREVSKQLYR